MNAVRVIGRPHAGWRSLGLGRSHGRHRRRYVRQWARLQRKDHRFLRQQAMTARKYRATSKGRRITQQCCRRWQKKNRARIKRNSQRYYRLYVQQRCEFCNQPGRRGPGNGMKRIERLVPYPDRSGPSARGLELRTVNYCGRC